MAEIKISTVSVDELNQYIKKTVENTIKTSVDDSIKNTIEKTITINIKTIIEEIFKQHKEEAKSFMSLMISPIINSIEILTKNIEDYRKELKEQDSQWIHKTDAMHIFNCSNRSLTRKIKNKGITRKIIGGKLYLKRDEVLKENNNEELKGSKYTGGKEELRKLAS